MIENTGSKYFDHVLYILPLKSRSWYYFAA